MDCNKKILIGIVITALLLALVWYVFLRKKTESYSNIGDIDNIGGLVDNCFERTEAPEMSVPGQNYADLVDDSARRAIDAQSRPGPNIMKRLDDLQGSALMPRVSKDVTPYNIDVADVTTQAYMVNTPRVQLKSPQWQQSDKYRGDIPITYHPNIPVITKTRYDRDSLNLTGFFSDGYNALYDKYTGKAYKSMPYKVSNEETVMDYC